MSHPWMPFYVADYLSDTRRLTTVEHGAYLLLIMEYWQHGSLPDDDSELAQIVLMSEKEWKRIRAKMERFFDAGWKHKRIDEELAKADAKSQARAEAGSRGGKSKAKQSSSKPLAIATDLPKQKPTDALASSSQPESQAASAAGALVDFKKSIMDAFRQAGSTSFPDTHRAEIWASQGYNPSICVAVIRECLARKPSISRLNYFDNAIREAHEKTPSFQFAASAPKEISDDDWRSWLRRYKSGDGPWPASLGPRPRMGGCLVPAHVLAEFLPAIIALEKERAPLAGVS